MLRSRLIFGCLMIIAMLGVLIADAWFAPYYPLLFIVALAVVGSGARELALLLRKLPLEVKPWFCVLGTWTICTANWLPHVIGGAESLSPDVVLPMIAFVLLGMLSLIIAAWEYDSRGIHVAAACGHVFVFFYLGLLGSFVVQVRWLGDRPAVGAVALAMLIFTPKFCDIGAYFTGRWLGRTKMAPKLSPGKTWEGIAGGVLLAVLLAIVLAWAAQSVLGGRTLSSLRAACFGLVLGIVGPIGDLVESLIKRECRQKDASTSIPGFGGTLDVVDSVLFSGPVAYLLLNWFLAH